MVHCNRFAIALALGAMSLAGFMPAPAAAGGCNSDDSAYCGDRDYGYRDRDDYRDYGYRHAYRDYDDRRYNDVNDYGGYRYGDYDRGYGLACDPDGDRCYRSSSGYWDYHVYYRLHGYHWN